MKTIADLSNGRKFCFYVSPIMKAEDSGHRLSVVIEGERGYFETNLILPDNYAVACNIAAAYNAMYDVKPEDEERIILTSMECVGKGESETVH